MASNFYELFDSAEKGIFDKLKQKKEPGDPLTTHDCKKFLTLLLKRGYIHKPDWKPMRDPKYLKEQIAKLNTDGSYDSFKTINVLGYPVLIAPAIYPGSFARFYVPEENAQGKRRIALYLTAAMMKQHKDIADQCMKSSGAQESFTHQPVTELQMGAIGKRLAGAVSSKYNAKVSRVNIKSVDIEGDWSTAFEAADAIGDIVDSMAYNEKIIKAVNPIKILGNTMIRVSFY